MVLSDSIILGHDHQHLEVGCAARRDELGLEVQVATVGQHVQNAIGRHLNVGIANDGDQEVEENDLYKQDVHDPNEPDEENHQIVPQSEELLTLGPVLVSWARQVTERVTEHLEEICPSSIDVKVRIQVVLTETTTEQLERNGEEEHPEQQEHHECHELLEGHSDQFNLGTDTFEDPDIAHDSKQSLKQQQEMNQRHH